MMLVWVVHILEIARRCIGNSVPRRFKKRRSLHSWLAVRAGNARFIDDFCVGAWLISSQEELIRILARVDSALVLIKKRDPNRYRRMVHDMGRIFVTHLPTGGQYSPLSGDCFLDQKFVLAEWATPESIASIIVHEATHARLRNSGIGYKEAMRPRVERACIRRQIAFGKNLPNGQQVISDAVRALELCAVEGYFSAATMRKRNIEGEIENLRQGELPEWWIERILSLARFSSSPIARILTSPLLYCSRFLYFMARPKPRRRLPAARR